MTRALWVGVLLAATAAPAAERCVEVQGHKVCGEPAGAPHRPLLVFLHGYGRSGKDDELGLCRAAAARGWGCVAPDARPNQAGHTEWQAADAEFVTAAIRDFAAAFRSDPRQIELAGFSLGGFLALDLACAHPDLIAAVASVSGTRFAPVPQCHSGSVSTLHVHGENDTVVAPAGGVGKRTAKRYLSDLEAAEISAEAAGCTGKLAAAGTNAFGAQVRRASKCRGDAAVEVWMLPGVAHVPPPAIDSGILDFLARHPRPAR